MTNSFFDFWGITKDKISLIIILSCLLLPQLALCYTDLAIKTAKEIAYESTLPSTGPLGYPLPLAASWNTGQYGTEWTPNYMVGLIETGHHVLPSFFFIDSSNTYWNSSLQYSAYYSRAMSKCKDLALPIAFVGTQWEYLLSKDNIYRNLPAATNPNVVQPDGKVQYRISPFGQPSHWREVGERWTNTRIVSSAQAQYQNPPRVYWLSNNEHPKLWWWESWVTQDAKYLALYGRGQSEVFRRTVVGDQYKILYGAMIAGMKSKLTSNWSNVSKFIGYEANQDRSYGRWGGWVETGLWTTSSISPWPYVWDGTSVSYYSDNWSKITDFQVFSAQTESMNWVFQKLGAFKHKADYVFEMSVWDGDSGKAGKIEEYGALGQTYTPSRYKGWLQFGMWVNKPRIVREFRGHLDTIADKGSYWLALLDAVDTVWENPTLKRFWRFGVLVENETYPHPYQVSIPSEYQSVPRNFMLNTSHDPARPWNFYSRINVFSMALLIGSMPNREWLVYVYSPLQKYSGVQVAIPGYGIIIVDSSISGSFYHVNETDKEVTPIRLKAPISPVQGLRIIP